MNGGWGSLGTDPGPDFVVVRFGSDNGCGLAPAASGPVWLPALLAAAVAAARRRR